MERKKVTLVTGGAKGIGAAICRKFAEEGYKIAVNYKNSEEKAKELKKELSKITEIEIFKADLTDSSQVDKMFSGIENVFGGVDILVNNAGVAQQMLFTDISDEMWHDMLNANLSSAFYCSRRALKYMINQKYGAIINITSMWGEVGASMEVHYSASKAGLIGLTKALAKEVGLSGITVNAVSPGVINTDMMADFSEEDKAVLKNETPMGVLGEPEDIANAVSFLASEKGRFITGQILSVNGGFII